MEILSVTLKNFKSHSERRFSFQPGTNAICGENGAGKTSILEAIAWVLFNHRGAYKNEDLIRNGTSSAQVMVAFISNRDGRTYEVQRCTTKGYSIFDPQLAVRLDYRHIEEEIMPWLRQQLGVAPGTDLARLFANTIGVPQGTFTADFLQPSEKRKQIFDSILKVEEYRQTNQQLLSLEKYGKAEVLQTISLYEEALSGRDPLEQRCQTLRQEISENEATLAQLQLRLGTLATEKAQISQQAEQMQRLTGRLTQLQAQREGKQQAIELLQQGVERSQQAVNFCLANRDSYHHVLQAEAKLRELDPQLKQRQRLWQQRESQQQRLNQQQQQATRLSLQLEALSAAATQLEQLQPLIAQQNQLEQQQSEVTEQLNQLQALKREQQSLCQQLSQSQQEQAGLQQALAQIPIYQVAVDQIPALEQKRERLQEQLSRLEAAQQFEAELRELVTLGESRHDQYETQAEAALALLQATLPALQVAGQANGQANGQAGPLTQSPIESVIAALQSGIDLNSDLLNALWRVLADLSEQTSPQKLHLRLQQIKTQLTTAQQQQQQLTRLEAQQTQQQHWQEMILQLERRIAQIQQQLTTEADWQQQRTDFSQQLSALSNPKGRYQLLERDLQQQATLSNQQASLNAQQAILQQALLDLETQLAAFAELDAEIEQHQALRQTHHLGYQTYLEYQKDANQHAQLKAELQTQLQQIQQIEADLLALQQEQQLLAVTYDPERFQALETEWLGTRSQADQIAGSLPQQQKLLAELDSQLNQLQAIAKKYDRAQVELKQTEKLRKFISFARKAFKEAGPRITERYVQTVSREADRLFRELLNRSNVALEWTRDYEIIVQEGAHGRKLLNLSGGEQMCAALAVRLALLRVLADIDIAFFDEPTTNMDRLRRQSLAEAIGNIKTFRQLFVISHDDTFEQVTENVILVEREV